MYFPRLKPKRKPTIYNLYKICGTISENWEFKESDTSISLTHVQITNSDFQAFQTLRDLFNLIVSQTTFSRYGKYNVSKIHFVAVLTYTGMSDLDGVFRLSPSAGQHKVEV